MKLTIGHLMALIFQPVRCGPIKVVEGWGREEARLSQKTPKNLALPHCVKKKLRGLKVSKRVTKPYPNGQNEKASLWLLHFLQKLSLFQGTTII